MTGALPPSSRWTRLRLRGSLGDLRPGAHRAGDGDHLRGLVRDQRPTGVAVAADDVEDAGREELLAQLAEQHRGGRGRVPGLEDDRVASREGRGDLPDHHHQRVVPGRHLAHDADRLAPHPRGVVGEVLPRRPALEDPGGAGEEPEVVRGVGISSAMVRPSGLPVSRHSTALISSMRASTASAILSSALPRSWGVVRPRSRRRARPRRTRGRGPRPRTSGPGVDLAGGRVDDVVGLARGRGTASPSTTLGRSGRPWRESSQNSTDSIEVGLLPRILAFPRNLARRPRRSRGRPPTWRRPASPRSPRPARRRGPGRAPPGRRRRPAPTPASSRWFTQALPEV